jgi:Ca2+-binding RTX toxin-like protein
MAILLGNDWPNLIDGTNASDVIWGYGDDDDLYGYSGDDDIYGGWGYDIAFGGNGDDYLNGGDGDDDLYGGSAQDRIVGGSGYDLLFGQSGNDDLYGQSGYDDLYGGSGLDYLNGGSSDDWLDGGRGRDWLVGGTGVDMFYFERSSSGITTASADTIADWRARVDWIDMSIRGTSGNYREASTTATSIEAAAAQAEGRFTSASTVHVFLYNAATDRGYLLSDLNNDNRYETGVVIRGAGSAADMDYRWIL